MGKLQARSCVGGDKPGYDDGLAGLREGPAGPELAGWYGRKSTPIENGSQLECAMPEPARRRMVWRFLRTLNVK